MNAVHSPTINERHRSIFAHFRGAVTSRLRHRVTGERAGGLAEEEFCLRSMEKACAVQRGGFTDQLAITPDWRRRRADQAVSGRGQEVTTCEVIMLQWTLSSQLIALIRRSPVSLLSPAPATVLYACCTRFMLPAQTQTFSSALHPA